MEDRPVVEAQIPPAPPGPGARRRRLVAAVVTAVVLGGFFAVTRPGREPSVRVEADQASMEPVTGPLDAVVPEPGPVPVPAMPPPPPEMAPTTAPRPEPTTTTTTAGPVPPSTAPAPTPAPDSGSWPGYRKAGYTGFFWGGNEEVGFYDNPAGDGPPCVLWRRFGGPEEGVILDVCPPAADALFPFAQLLTERPAPHLVRIAVVVDAPATGWDCAWDTGATCSASGSAITDTAGSGRSFLAFFPGAFERHGDRLTVTAYQGDTTVGQVTLDAPSR